MKISFDLDLTPAEARELLGLPDIKDVQDEWVKALQTKLMEEVENTTPEKIVQSWVSGASTNMDWLPNMFTAFNQGSKSDS